MVDDKPPVKVGPSASIYVTADVYHSTVNTGTTPMKMIVVYSPAGLTGYYGESRALRLFQRFERNRILLAATV